jgi:type IV pilus assembly protein PilV
MIEVLMGLAILAVGASGVIALQKVTVLGVTHGRNINTATSIAAAHLEALRADAQRWNSLTDYMTDATLLQAVHPGTTVGPGNWTLPPTAFPNDDEPGPGLGVSDITGATDEEDPEGPPVAYCTHVRVTPIIYDPAAPRTGTAAQAQDALMLRLEVRTFWAKAGREVRAECQPGFEPVMTAGLAGDPIPVDGVSYTADDYGWIFLATAVRRNLIAEPR